MEVVEYRVLSMRHEWKRMRGKKREERRGEEKGDAYVFGGGRWDEEESHGLQ